MMQMYNSRSKKERKKEKEQQSEHTKIRRKQIQSKFCRSEKRTNMMNEINKT